MYKSISGIAVNLALTSLRECFFINENLAPSGLDGRMRYYTIRRSALGAAEPRPAATSTNNASYSSTVS